MDPHMERLIRNINTTKRLRDACEKNEELAKCLRNSLSAPQALVEDVIKRLYLKDNIFKIYDSATEDMMQQYGRELEVFGIDIRNIYDTEKPIAKNDAFEIFSKTHCTKRTYFFQIRKCGDPSCTFHKEIRGGHKITIFPDPIPYEDDGVMR